MNVMNILRKSGRMEVADLASLLLPVSVVGREKNDLDDDDSGEGCEECGEEDEEVCVLCRLGGIIHKTGQNGKASNEDNHSPPHRIESRRQNFPFHSWG